MLQGLSTAENNSVFLNAHQIFQVSKTQCTQLWIEWSRLEPWPGIVFTGKTLDSHRASLPPGLQMGNSEFNAGGNPAMD